MRVITKRKLIEYWNANPDAKSALREWLATTRHATWTTPQDIKATHASASFLPNNRVVFNIKGNKHRLVVVIAYKRGVVYIRFVGTHAEYNKIDALTI
jgi:mRNA interferase HigB